MMNSSIMNISGLRSDQKTNQVATNGKIKEKQRTYLCHCITSSFIHIINTVYNIGACRNAKKRMIIEQQICG